MNPAAMTERLIDAAVYNEEAQGGYVAGARKELNEARAAIEDALSSQSLSLSEAREDRDSWRRVAERCESEKQAAQATIKRMDRAASEANALYLKMSAERDAAMEEIERLRGALLVVRPVVAGLIDAQYNVETWGLKGRLAKLDSELRRERVCEVCGGDCSAANPPPSYCPERDDFSALENSKAGLADANTNPASSDLSSLRKGAEVAVKPLEWDLSRMARGYPAKAVSIFGNYTAWEIEDGFWMPPEAHCGRRAGVGLQSALDAAQLDFETRIRSALVSGSREDGADAP